MLNQCIAVVAVLASLAAPSAASGHDGSVVVCNRGSWSISVIDVATDTATTVSLPKGDERPEPMYVVPVGNRVFVGDRANNSVVALDRRDWSVRGSVPAGEGVFHMWAGPFGQQVWVVNDIDNTVTVFNPRTLEVVADFPIPADIVARGGRPHDVVVGWFTGFVSIVGLDGDPDNDAIIQFSKGDFRELARAEVGGDPHLSLQPFSTRLYVPQQNGDKVSVFSRFGLREIDELDVDGAHGAWMARRGRVFYTTNLPGGGAGGLVTIDTRRRRVLGTTDTPYAVPHNIATTPNGRKVYVTHSGVAADKVTVYSATRRDPVPQLIKEITVGINPFGITYVR